MEKQTDFRIRSYGRTELAQLYNPCLTPKAAYRKLVGWIDHYPGLVALLYDLAGEEEFRRLAHEAVELYIREREKGEKA